MTLPRLLLRLVLGRRRPVHAGELRVRGPAAPVTVRRDARGVPHVDARSDADAAFALGFCQGQDRGGQLELLWRAGRGRLAEWVGPPGLRVDRLSRRVGFRRAAEAQLPALGEAERAFLAAFAAGVTAGHTAGLSAKPHEFAVLGGVPSAWDAADVLAVLKFQSFLMPSNWDVELARLRLLVADGPDALRALDPALGGGGEPAPAGAAGGLAAVLDQFEQDLAALARFLPVPAGGGSNNWAIAGGRTATGKPLLACDPHLMPVCPGPWYLAHARTPDWEVAGAMMAGFPVFPVGHNGFAAWGVTAAMTDTTDLFLETLGPDRAGTREADGSFRPCTVVREVIRVRKKPDVVEDVLVTPRGPVIGAVDGVPAALSIRAAWLDPLPLVGFLGAPRARSLAAFRACFEHWPTMPLNVVYADAGGAVGWQVVGRVPRRPGGPHLLPRPADAPGWDAAPVPFADLPHAADPPAGFVATANNAPPAAPPALGADYLDPHRFLVITDELGKRADWDAAGCAALQLSTRSLPWEQIRDTVLSLAPAGRDAAEALALLRDWDGAVSADSPAAAVYELFAAELCVRAAKAKAPRGWRAAVGEGGLDAGGHSLFAERRVGHLVGLVRSQPAGWFARGWPAEMADVLGGVVRRLRRDHGPGPAYWAWGHLRLLRFEHPLFGKSRLLGPAFNLGPVAVGGDSHTVSQAAVRPATPTAPPHFVANLRAVFDLADLGRSTFVLAGGQSGNPCSPHYADQLPLWHAGEAAPLPWAPEQVIRDARAVLRLLPA